jgi:uncharacterized protein YbjT (DUF2867 family)
MYVILGATGNTGAGIAELLLAKHQSVRVVGRSKDRLTRFTSRGADGFVADVTDSAALEKAFQGARAVYALIPPNMGSNNVRAYQDEVVASVGKALEASGVKHVVALSSFGADKAEKTGPVVGLHVLEERLAKIRGLNVLNLRAGYFMENLLPQIDVIKNFGMMAGPVKADLPLPMIATRDIASVAGEALLELNFSGQQSRELQGQRDVTYLEVARVIGTGIGRPALAYVQLPGEQVIQAMTQMGMSKNMAALIVEMADSLNSGYMRTLEPRSISNSNPTPVERFVQDVFLPAYRGGQATSA